MRFISIKIFSNKTIEKNNNNEFVRFLKIAKGSSGEVRNQLYIALAINYISQEEFDKSAIRKWFVDSEEYQNFNFEFIMNLPTHRPLFEIFVGENPNGSYFTIDDIQIEKVN